MMGTKTYSFETMFVSLAEGLKEFLNDTVDRFYVTDGRTWHGEPMLWHFSIEATPTQAELINAWLDAHTITAI